MKLQSLLESQQSTSIEQQLTDARVQLENLADQYNSAQYQADDILWTITNHETVALKRVHDIGSDEDLAAYIRNNPSLLIVRWREMYRNTAVSYIAPDINAKDIDAANWAAYQAWSIAARIIKINNRIKKLQARFNKAPTVNTGSLSTTPPTQSRIEIGNMTYVNPYLDPAATNIHVGDPTAVNWINVRIRNWVMLFIRTVEYMGSAITTFNYGVINGEDCCYIETANGYGCLVMGALRGTRCKIFSKAVTRKWMYGVTAIGNNVVASANQLNRYLPMA